MPRKERTPEERAAWGQMMRERKAQKQAERIKQAADSVNEEVSQIKHPAPGEGPKMDGEDVQGLIKRVNELAAQVQFLQGSPHRQQSHMTPRGLVGVTDRYIIDPKHYPDPRSRLSEEPKLRPVAFDQNYELGWEVRSTQYEHNGVNYQEPKFTLKLIRRMLDEDSGEDTGKRYMICQAIFHEDPQAAITIAGEQGLNINDYNEEDFLNEMRYLRMRDWLLEAFYPPKPASATQKHQQVIGNRLVEVYEISSEKREAIPFSQLTKKL